jgi:hypothetical protein
MATLKQTISLIEKVYDWITDATSDIWIPIHMNHMFVNEAYRVWHGEPFKEGYLQAPPNTDHFDLHRQGPTTDTEYKALETIPGLNIGGFFDAGDFDIETGSNISVVQNFVQTWEYFEPLRDQTFIDEEAALCGSSPSGRNTRRVAVYRTWNTCNWSLRQRLSATWHKRFPILFLTITITWVTQLPSQTAFLTIRTLGPTK